MRSEIMYLVIVLRKKKLDMLYNRLIEKNC